MGFHDVELMCPAIIDRHWEEINSWRNWNLVLWRQWEDFCIIIRSRSWFSIYLFFPRQQSYFFNSLQRRKYKDVEDRPWHNGDLDMGLESSRFAPRSPLCPTYVFFPPNPIFRRKLNVTERCNMVHNFQFHDFLQNIVTMIMSCRMK